MKSLDILGEYYIVATSVIEGLQCDIREGSLQGMQERVNGESVEMGREWVMLVCPCLGFEDIRAVTYVRRSYVGEISQS